MQLAKLDPVALSIGKYWKKMGAKAIERINLFLNRWYGHLWRARCLLCNDEQIRIPSKCDS